MTRLPSRIRLSRAAGWRLPDRAVNVARPGCWGNPFIVGKHGTRAQVVWRFAILSQGFINIGIETPSAELQLMVHDHLKLAIGSLKGRDLACWCSHDGPCHADVLLHLANGGKPADLARMYAVDLPTAGVGLDANDVRGGLIGRANRRPAP